MAVASVVWAGMAWGVGGLGSCVLLAIAPLFAVGTMAVFFVGSLGAVVTGYVGREQIRASGGAQAGDGLARAGMLLGGVGLALSGLVLCMILVMTLIGPAVGNTLPGVPG